MASPLERQPSPFNPGYGKKPAIYGGRQKEVNELVDVFETLDFGDNNSILVSGLRGAGKTALLTLLEDEARSRGWIVISDDASRGLMTRVMESTIPRLLSDQPDSVKARLTSLNLWQFGANWEYVQRTRPGRPQLRTDLVDMSAALNGKAGILITIDEVASGRVRLKELSEFALQVQHALTDGAQIMIVFAGVKVDLEALLSQHHLTFLRRSKEYDFRRLSFEDTCSVLTQTVNFGSRTIDEEAVTHLARISQGYPYLIQLAGDYSWRHRADAPSITIEDARYAEPHALKAVQSRVISRVYDDLSEMDKSFLQAMVLDEGPSKIADIKERLGKPDQYIQVYKKRLIDTGYVQSAAHGYIEFSLPYLDQYVRSLGNGDPRDNESVSISWKDVPPVKL